MMLNNVLSNVDFIEYLITIFAFELSPGIAFIIVIRNTINPKVAGMFPILDSASNTLVDFMLLNNPLDYHT